MGSEVAQRALLVAAAHGDIGGIRSALAAGADIDGGFGGCSPGAAAIVRQQGLAAEYLRQSGADPKKASQQACNSEGVRWAVIEAWPEFQEFLDQVMADK